jgi:hypothetical protein
MDALDGSPVLGVHLVGPIFVVVLKVLVTSSAD